MPPDRRHGNIVALAALVATLLTNIIALTWGASKMSSAVDGLESTTSQLTLAVRDIQTFNAGIATRMGIVEDRVLRNKAIIDNSNSK